MLTWYIVALAKANLAEASLVDFICFFLLGIQLLIVNVILLTLMKGILRMTNVTLQKERNFLICTLTLFSISYILSTARNIILYSLYRNEKQVDMPDWSDWFCDGNFNLAIFNTSFYIVTEWIPYAIIFSLNYKNYSRIESYYGSHKQK